jgi:hypothetical protein
VFFFWASVLAAEVAMAPSKLYGDGDLKVLLISGVTAIS